MKKLIIALALVLVASGAWAEGEKPGYPSSCIVYGFADNGRRYECINIFCVPEKDGIMCSFESKSVRFPDKNIQKNLEQFYKSGKNEQKKAQNDFYKLCSNVEKIIDRKKNIKNNYRV